MWPILRNFLMVLCLMAVGAIAVGSYTHLFNASSGGKHAQLPEKYDNQTRNDWKIEIDASSHGHFRVEVEINGENEEFLVDTGASMVSFSL